MKLIIENCFGVMTYHGRKIHLALELPAEDENKLPLTLCNQGMHRETFFRIESMTLDVALPKAMPVCSFCAAAYKRMQKFLADEREEFYLHNTTKPDADNEDDWLQLNLSEETFNFIVKHFGNGSAIDANINTARLAWLVSYPYDALPEAVRTNLFEEAVRLNCKALIPRNSQWRFGIW